MAGKPVKSNCSAHSTFEKVWQGKYTLALKPEPLFSIKGGVPSTIALTLVFLLLIQYL